MSLTPERTAELQELCRQYRIDVLTAIHGAQSGHPGGSLSACEILTLLYQQRMHVDAAHPDDPNRDRLVLCKGHAAPMLYRNLIGKGFLPIESMNTLRQTGSPLEPFHRPGGTAAKDTVHRAAVAAVAVEQGLYGPDVAAGAASAQHRQQRRRTALPVRRRCRRN